VMVACGQHALTAHTEGMEQSISERVLWFLYEHDNAPMDLIFVRRGLDAEVYHHRQSRQQRHEEALCGRGGSPQPQLVKDVLRRQWVYFAQYGWFLSACAYLLISSQLLCRFAPQQCACETADKVPVAASARIKWT